MNIIILSISLVSLLLINYLIVKLKILIDINTSSSHKISDLKTPYQEGYFL